MPVKKSLVSNLQLPAIRGGARNLNERLDVCSRPTAQAHRAGSGHDAVEARAKKRSSRTPQRRAPGVGGAVFRRGYARTLRVTPPWPKAIRPAPPTTSGQLRSAKRHATPGRGPTPHFAWGGTLAGWPGEEEERARAWGAARRGALAPPERHASPPTPGARLSKPAAALLCPRFPDHECRCLPGGPETFESSMLSAGGCSSLLAAAHRRGIFPARGCRREQRRVFRAPRLRAPVGGRGCRRE
jgi:hypothetical protein